MATPFSVGVGMVLACVFTVCSSYPVDMSTLTVSGISSGGYMAVQFHVAYSSHISGAGVVAGGPYWCAQGDVAIAESACMANPGLISLDELYAATTYAEGLDSIDPTSHLKDDRVWLFSGTRDTIVNPGVMSKLAQYYGHYISSSSGGSIVTEFTVEAEHCFPTLAYGDTCIHLGTPFINRCNYDAAGQILAHMYPDTTLLPPTTANATNVKKIAQSGFVPSPFSSKEIGLQDYAYLYVPTQCNMSGTHPCKIHIAFHGCEQTVDYINTTFVFHSGYNEWAESNNIIIVYPQARANDLNPKGCFDWWGYAGPDYATKIGPQMVTIYKMTNSVPSMGGDDLQDIVGDTKWSW
eukprot:TRINITY_DN2040_c0_g1_i1.p1 TRINITY_DN2040_c0_g1~~TRINITY_DN2040_c0_g1_i1.p1  ORF type:complete len:359 (-),score=86.87 TRINITY_DN2040_c0_g1_i1:13-1065(-)